MFLKLAFKNEVRVGWYQQPRAREKGHPWVTLQFGVVVILKLYLLTFPQVKEGTGKSAQVSSKCLFLVER